VGRLLVEMRELVGRQAVRRRQKFDVSPLPENAAVVDEGACARPALDA
jgi:hypothetical protein